MSTWDSDDLEKVELRGFEPKDGYNPLRFTHSHNETYDTYYTEQISQSEPIPITILTYLDNLNYIETGTYNKIVWEGKVPSGLTSTPPNAVGIRIYNTSHQIEVSQGVYDYRGDIYVYFVDEQGNNLPNEFHINLEGINDASFEVEGNLASLVLCYREDITPPQLCFGISYKLARYYSFPHEDTPTVLSYRAVHLGTQMIGNPNEPFISWYKQNENSPWYDSESEVPDLTEGGGGGSLFRNSIDIPVPPLPPFEICGTNFIRLYNLTNAELSALGNYLWSDNFFDNIIKNWTSPLQNIISLSVVPLINLQATNEVIQIGNTSTGVPAMRLTNSRYQISMGTVQTSKMYNSFADFNPFQRLKVFLPYIGVRELNTDDYIGGSLEIVYQIDIFTGSCVAHLVAHKNGKNYVVDSYNGNISMQLPMTGANYFSAFQASLNGLMTTMVGNPIGGAVQGLNLKPSYEKSGTLTGQNGRLGVKYPYLFFDTPKFKAPKTFRQEHGYLSNLSVTLNQCTGYTEIKYINLDDLTALDTEKDEIINLLTTGIYI